MPEPLIRLPRQTDKRSFPGWENPALPPPLTITAAAGLWRARRGFLIHWPRYGRIYIREPYRWTHFTWLCGNSSNEPIPVKAECMEGLSECQKCKAIAEKPDA